MQGAAHRKPRHAARGPLRRIEDLLRLVSIRERLVFTFVVLLLLMLAIAAVGVFQMQAIEQAGGAAGGTARGIRMLAVACAIGGAIQFAFCYWWWRRSCVRSKSR